MTTLYERLLWAKQHLNPVQSKYRVVFEDPAEPEAAAKILCPDPNWLAAALHGGILPPVSAYWELAKDEAQPDFTRHTRGHLLHESTIDALTEEEAIEYLIMKDIPPRVWADNTANAPRFRIVPVELIPTNREFRGAWRLAA